MMRKHPIFCAAAAGLTAVSLSACALVAPSRAESEPANLPTSKGEPLTEPPELRGEIPPDVPLSPEPPAAELAEPASVEAPVAEPGTEDDVERTIAYIESIDTLKGRFAQISPDGALATGAFYLKRPGRVRFEYDPPSPTLVVADGVRVVIQDRDLETTDGYPINATPLKFLLGENIDRDEIRVLDVIREPGALTVAVASRDEETPGSIAVTLAEPALELRQWVVTDAQGLQTTVILSDLQRAVDLDPGLFVARDTRRFLDSDGARPR
ncbi:MAG: outer-membrane lipoprotein carrier protein LolA [Pseudomonadota bacterium]